jgi:hypothetical protein
LTSSLLEAATPELVAFVVSGLVVLYAWPGAAGFRAWIDRTIVRRFRGISWIHWDWRIVAIVLGAVFVAAAFVQSRPIPCSAGEDDTTALLQSARNFLAGGNPFTTTQCGHQVLVPYGLANILLDALGSFAGRVGIWLVWNLLALLLIPLVWLLGGAQRWYATIFVATSMIYAPLVVGSIQGGNSAVVPVTALLGIWLAVRRNPAAGGVVGFLSTVKFPSLFPFWGGLAGVGAERWRALVLSVVVFAGLSLLVVAIWGGHAYSLLFTSQLTRADFSINEFGVLIPARAMPPTLVLEAIQGVALLGALIFVHVRRWAAVPAVALLTIVVVLVAQRFTENFLIWLLPVALLGPTYARWLFVLGVIGVADATLALPACMNQGACAASQGLGGAFGLVLVVLLVLILREGSGLAASGPGASSKSAAASSNVVPAGPDGPPVTFHSALRFEGPADTTGPSWATGTTTLPPDG